MKKESAKQSGEPLKSKSQKATIPAKPPTGGNDKAVGKEIAGSKGTGGKAMAKKGGRK
jgi:hypothetical protein